MNSSPRLWEFFSTLTSKCEVLLIKIFETALLRVLKSSTLRFVHSTIPVHLFTQPPSPLIASRLHQLSGISHIMFIFQKNLYKNGARRLLLANTYLQRYQKNSWRHHCRCRKRLTRVGELNYIQGTNANDPQNQIKIQKSSQLASSLFLWASKEPLNYLWSFFTWDSWSVASQHFFYSSNVTWERYQASC